jgi:predicted HTH transcriptional regulator
MVFHRDYRDSGNSIVRIFENRIEFFNQGKLFAGLTIGNLLSGEYASISRNGALVRIFKDWGLTSF